MRQRRGLHVPITPKVGGRVPAFVVACLDCPFCVDAHGQDAEEAVLSVAPSHQAGHRLIARDVNYAEHPLYS